MCFLQFDSISLSKLAGLWNSGNSLGSFLGPTIGGILIDNYGYQATALYFVGAYCLLMAANAKELWTVVHDKREG